MKFKLYSASGKVSESEIEILSLQDLIDLSKKYNDDQLVIDFQDLSITIYDGYLE